MADQAENDFPNGKYTFIGVDIDTTGRRILDEIVHLAAYTPKVEFDQFVIPLMNLNPAARQRHQIRVITVGFFRMLKCILTNKVMKSKTELIALRSFLDWLEERKAEDKDSNGVVLIYHEPIKFIPFMLLEAYKRYELLERFMDVVVGFVDGNALSMSKCATVVKYNSLRQMAKLFMDVGDENDPKNFEGNAIVRARLAYQIVHHLSQGDNENANEEITSETVQGFIHSVKANMEELTDQNKCMALQHTFRPIFVNYFKTNLYHRYKAVTYRRVLAEKGFDLVGLQSIWNEKHKEGIAAIVEQLDEIKEENREELVNILDSYFDPEKELIMPAVKKPIRNRRQYKKDNKENGNAGTESDQAPLSPDSGTRSPRKHRRSRRRFNNRRSLNKGSMGKDDLNLANEHTHPTEVTVGAN